MEEGEPDVNFNVFVGSETGVLKAIYFGDAEAAPRLKNFHTFSKQSTITKTEMVSLNWGYENDEKELIVGFSNNAVKIYNLKLQSYTHGTPLPIDPEKHGNLVGLYNNESNFIYGTSNGKLFNWNYMQEGDPIEISTGSHLAKLTRCMTDMKLYATGGKETELRIWNMETPETPIFKARNVPHDFLDLRVPVWVQDITFLREANDLLAISTRYGQVRLYDTRADTRPTIDMQFVEQPLMAISTVSSNSRHVLVGSSWGTLALIDLRSTKGALIRKYDGFTGGVRSIYAHPTLPIFTSCGLDRHIYMHELHEKAPKKKLYLKSSLHSVIMSKRLTCTGPTAAAENIPEDVLLEKCKGSRAMYSDKCKDASTPSPAKKKKLKH